MDLSLFLAAGATVTKAVDFTRNLVDADGVAPKWLWNLAAFGYGVLISFASDLSVYNSDLSSGWDKVITGLAIGAASSGFHEVFDFFSAKAKGVEPAPIELIEKKAGL